MSDELAKTIERLEQWVEHWQPHYPPEFIADLQKFIADLKTLIGVAKAAVRAVEMLKDAEDVSVTYDEDGDTALMVCAHLVDKAVAILQEGQQ